MNVIVQSKTIPVTAAIRRVATMQAERLQKHSKKILQICVFLETVKRRKNEVTAAMAKFLIRMPGKEVIVQEHAVDLYQAIHDAANAALREINDFKERRLNRVALG